LWKGEAIEVSAEELRIQIRALAAPFSGILEEAADQVIAWSDEPRVKEDALRFKINAIPAMQTALFQRDPLAALYDTWAFIWQMRAFWDGGFGGQAQPAEALRAGHEATDRMEQYLEHVAAHAIEGDDAMAATRRAVQDWARENPMTRGFRSRPSATVDLAHFMGESNQGLLRTAAALRENVDDLTSRIDVYVAFLPKQARWQTELLLAQTTGTWVSINYPARWARWSSTSAPSAGLSRKSPVWFTENASRSSTHSGRSAWLRSPT
jgi:hypothetical protein